ncbi:hypothetical protein BDW42DRAFT_160473 [Aspergillus taichungensis]|uniref:Secreted protein n=1 Tax=Aspergillus taichungensis TaxID=482145 RepID=A0A2J5I667_9EURO|nr:hypothetical protein BDW42DRAFT_160473 [Aspergillus taichungensis]
MAIKGSTAILAACSALTAFEFAACCVISSPSSREDVASVSGMSGMARSRSILARNGLIWSLVRGLDSLRVGQPPI